MTERTNQLMYEDNLMVARRFTDTRRYAADRWNAAHAEPIDEGQVALYLTDEHYGTLSDEQKKFVRECRDEMHSVYRDIVFRIASDTDVDVPTLDRLRGRCVMDAKRTNGTISFKDILKFQKSL